MILFSSKEKKILEIAKKEVHPKLALEFEPITRGPFFALLGIIAIGFLGLFYIIVMRFCGRKP